MMRAKEQAHAAEQEARLQKFQKNVRHRVRMMQESKRCAASLTAHLAVEQHATAMAATLMAHDRPRAPLIIRNLLSQAIVVGCLQPPSSRPPASQQPHMGLYEQAETVHDITQHARARLCAFKHPVHEDSDVPGGIWSQQHLQASALQSLQRLQGERQEVCM